MVAGGSITGPVPEVNSLGSCPGPLVTAAGAPAQCDSSPWVEIHAVAWGHAVAVSARYDPQPGWRCVSRLDASPSAMLDIPRGMRLQLSFGQSQNWVLDGSGSRLPPASWSQRALSGSGWVHFHPAHVALMSEISGSISASLLAPRHRNYPSDSSR